MVWRVVCFHTWNSHILHFTWTGGRFETKMKAIKSVLVTGANRGIGLEFIRQILASPTPPRHVIAACRNPAAAEVRMKSNCKLVISYVHRKMNTTCLLLAIQFNRFLVFTLVSWRIWRVLQHHTVISVQSSWVSMSWKTQKKKFLCRFLTMQSCAGADVNCDVDIGSCTKKHCTKSVLHHLFCVIPIFDASDQKWENVCLFSQFFFLIFFSDLDDTGSFDAVTKEVSKIVEDDGLQVLINNGGVLFPERSVPEGRRPLGTDPNFEVEGRHKCIYVPKWMVPTFTVVIEVWTCPRMGSGSIQDNRRRDMMFVDLKVCAHEGQPMCWHFSTVFSARFRALWLVEGQVINGEWHLSETLNAVLFRFNDVTEGSLMQTFKINAAAPVLLAKVRTK